MLPIPALKNPHEVNRPRLKRQVLSFKEALENLKNAKDGSVKCAAFHTYGRCHKDISFDQLYFLALLGQLSITDVGSIIDLMPLILCPTHWEKTVYYNAIFLDWASSPGLRLDTHDYENIVVDLESAKVIKEEECSAQETSVPSNATAEDQGRHGSATSSPKEGDFFLNGNDIQIPASRTNTKLLSGFISAASSIHTSNSTDSLTDEKEFQPQDYPSGGHQPAHTPPENEQAHEVILRTLNLVSLRAYASLELGVAKIEIMYQKSLKCISMASYGWRCQELIQSEQLLEARRLSSSLDGSKEKLKDLAKLVLCPGHSRGELPQLYSEAWSAFATKRLPKKEAMTRFSPDHWNSVQFFSEQNMHQMEPRKTKSTSNLHQTEFERTIRPSPDRVEVDSKLSTPGPRLPQAKRFEFFLSASSSNSESAIPRPPTSLRGDNSSKIPSATTGSIFTAHETSFSTSIPSQISAPVTNSVSTTSGDLDNAEKSRYTTSTVNPVNTSSTFDQSPAPSLAKRIIVSVPSNISPKGRITVRLPPNPSTVSSDVSNISSEFAQVRVSGGASSYDYRSWVNTAGGKDAAMSKDTRSDQTAQPQQSSAPLTFQRDLKLPVQMTHQGVIDGNIREEICSSIPSGGYVYIFKSADRNLIKIGKATNVARRKQQIRNGCQLEDLDEVDSGSYRLRYPERVERLVHLELLNFRANIICQHLRGSSNEEIEQGHREWFDVPEDVAVQSVQRWREFVEKAYTHEGTIREHWARKATLLPRSGSLEQRYLKTGLHEGNRNHLEKHHQLRHERYQDWMDSGDKDSFAWRKEN